MKKLLFSLPFLFSSLFAQDWEEVEFYEEAAIQQTPYYPFSVSGDYIYVSPTHFYTPDVDGQTLKYRQIDLAFAYTHPITECSGLIFGAGWVGTLVDWRENPDFHETHFNYVNFSLGGYTSSFSDWTWTLTLSAFIDTEELDLGDYALYQGVLWGRYSLCETFELDFGLINEIGLNKEKIWPILGFVYIPWPELKISAVYPVNISIMYSFWNYWTAGISARFLRNRHRVKSNEPLPQGIFEYMATGVEFDLGLTLWKLFTFKGFAGTTFDGDLKITNRNNHRATHYKFEGSFYAGATLILIF